MAVGLDAQEPELAEFLDDLYQSARNLPESAPMRGRLAIAYDANGFADAAATTYAQAEVLDPGEFLWPYQQAFLFAEGGRREEALRSLDRALAVDDGYVPAWLQRGAWLLDLHRNEDAAATFEFALDLDGGAEAEVVAKAGLARARLRQGRPAEAIALLEPLVADLDHPHLYRLLARAYRESGRAEQAKAAAARSKGAMPLRWRDPKRQAEDDYVRGFHGRLSLAETRLEQGRPEQAARLLESLRESRPDDRTLLNNLSIAYQLTGRPQRAFEVLEQGLSAHPGYHLFHFNIASLYEDRGQPLRAIEHFGRAAELAPGLVAAYERKGLLLIRQERYAEALATFNDMAPYGERAIALYYTAMIEGARGRWPQAVERLQQAVHLDPQLAKGYVFLGRGLAEMGRFDEARAAFDRASRLGTHPQEVASARARLAELASRS